MTPSRACLNLKSQAISPIFYIIANFKKEKQTIKTMKNLACRGENCTYSVIRGIAEQMIAHALEAKRVDSV